MSTTAYKTIVTYLPDVQMAERVLPLAMDVANRFQAHHIGLYVVPGIELFFVTSAYNDMAALVEMTDAQRSRHAEISAKVRALFEHHARGETFATEWRRIDSDRADPLDVIVDSAVSADLVIVPDFGPGDEVRPADETIAERIVLAAGRPTLIVPGASSGKPVGQHVAVAYNGTREAARAIFDALPFLCGAEIVRIIWVDPDPAAGKAPSRAADEIAASLARWNVPVEAVVAQTSDQSVFDAVMGRVRDHGSDLLVMGAFGHSRLQQRVFGGFSQRALAEELGIPILMSH